MIQPVDLQRAEAEPVVALADNATLDFDPERDGAIERTLIGKGAEMELRVEELSEKELADLADRVQEQQRIRQRGKKILPGLLARRKKLEDQKAQIESEIAKVNLQIETVKAGRPLETVTRATLKKSVMPARKKSSDISAEDLEARRQKKAAYMREYWARRRKQAA
jgi:hypothetical protein